MQSILVLLDIKNLWDNSYIAHGSKQRLDFQKVIRKAKINKNCKVNAFAFVSAVAGKKQDSLLKKLQSSNIEAVIYDEKMDMWPVFEANIDAADVFILGSGDAELAEFVIQANYRNKETYIMACAEGLDTKMANEADDILLLTKNETISL